jgi:protein FAM32A
LYNNFKTILRKIIRFSSQKSSLPPTFSKNVYWWIAPVERCSKEEKVTSLISSKIDRKKSSKSAKELPPTDDFEQVQVIDQQPQPIKEKTKAEIQFELIKQKRLEERIEKAAEKSHKERVNQFNTYLSKLSEHHDIPRVGPG